MKRWLELSPPLVDIERRLFGVSRGLIEAVEVGTVSEKIRSAVMASPEWKERLAEAESPQDSIAGTQAVELPAHLRDLVQRRAAVAQAKFDPIPAAGQIVEVIAIKTPRQGQLDWVMQVPLYVLLDAPAESAELWHGWLVSGETDYATSWDFVLQDQDAPFDPEAGMVQLWNPVRIYLPMASRVVAQLRLARLQAVRSLAADFLTAEAPTEAARPGRVAVRRIGAGFLVATGSPLGDDRDPRRRYQRVYHHAAEAMRVPARLAIAELASSGSTIGSFVKGLLDAAREAGDRLSLVPRIEVPMGQTMLAQEAIRVAEPYAAVRQDFMAHASLAAEMPPPDLDRAVVNAVRALATLIATLRQEQEHLQEFRSEFEAYKASKLANEERRADVEEFEREEREITRHLSALSETIARSADEGVRLQAWLTGVSATLVKDLRKLERAKRIIEEAAKEVPAPALGEGEEDLGTRDLSWHDIARIRVLSVGPNGGGQLLIVPGSRRVTAMVAVDGTMIDRLSVEPGGEPGRISWDAETAVKLILESDDGRRMELPLDARP
ncbi:MAG: hypothetical protein FJY37_03270 [Betaproteobacteria bacterium]|nr:hypothetical protein [Betaproteobacteria bacterium]